MLWKEGRVKWVHQVWDKVVGQDEPTKDHVIQVLNSLNYLKSTDKVTELDEVDLLSWDKLTNFILIIEHLPHDQTDNTFHAKAIAQRFQHLVFNRINSPNQS